MGIVKGFTSILGFKKASTWGTAVQIGSGEGIRFTKFDPGAELEEIKSQELSGSRSRLEGVRGEIIYKPSLEAEMQYEGLERLLAHALGTAGTPSQVSTDDAYTHVFKPSNELDGIFGTVAAYMKSKPAVLEVDSAKLDGFSFKVGVGQKLAMMTFPMIGRKVALNEGSGTNTNSTAGSITYPSNRDLVTFNQMAVRLNSTSGSALASGDLIYPTELEITAVNAHEKDVDGAHSPYSGEPQISDFLDVSVSMGFSKGFQDLDLLRDMLDESGVAKKVDVVFTGPLADGSTNFSLTFYLPSLRMMGDLTGIGGPGVQAEKINFTGNRVETVPSGFPSGYSDAVTVEVVNQNNADALA